MSALQLSFKSHGSDFHIISEQPSHDDGASKGRCSRRHRPFDLVDGIVLSPHPLEPDVQVAEYEEVGGNKHQGSVCYRPVNGHAWTFDKDTSVYRMGTTSSPRYLTCACAAHSPVQPVVVENKGQQVGFTVPIKSHRHGSYNPS